MDWWEWLLWLSAVPLGLATNLLTPRVGRALARASSRFAAVRGRWDAARQRRAETYDAAPNALIVHAAAGSALAAAFMILPFTLLGVLILIDAAGDAFGVSFLDRAALYVSVVVSAFLGARVFSLLFDMRRRLLRLARPRSDERATPEAASVIDPH